MSLLLIVALMQSIPAQQVWIGLPEGETPPPRRYTVSTEMDCDGTHFAVQIESGYPNSRLVSATADGAPLQVSIERGRPLADAIANVDVLGLSPMQCDAASSTVELVVRIYDADLDGLPGNDGELDILAIASPSPDGAADR